MMYRYNKMCEHLWRIAMRRFLGIVSLLVLLGFSPAKAQAIPDSAVIAVIQTQLDAFKADDFDTAFGLAAPSIQKHFGNVQRYRLMVIHSYPMVWRPASVQYLSAQSHAGQVFQRVMITDNNQAIHLLIYQMIPVGTQWRVGGVQILPTAKTDT
jgi:hypothetical protein